MRQCALIFLGIAYLSVTTESANNAWEEGCPSSCTCHLSRFSDLAVSSLVMRSTNRTQTEDNSDQHVTYQQKNEVLYEDDEKAYEFVNGNPILHSAMCVLTYGMEPHLLLTTLPQHLEALTILQGPDSGNITLGADSFSSMQHLIVLEIHGFHHISINNHSILRLHNDALKSLHSLQYLNLQHIHLLGHPGQGNKPAPLSASEFIAQMPDSKLDFNQLSPMFYTNLEHRKRERDDDLNSLPHRLQFIPEPNDGEILPYEIYREEQERGGLSTFAGLVNLIFLRIFHCNVREVNWEMFDGLHKLEMLSLERNHLLFIPDFSFYGTPYLKYLSLSHNKLLNIRSTSLAGLLQLQHLDLSYNNISYLSELSLPPFPKLKTADFHENPIELVLPNTFEVMNSTGELYLGGHGAILQLRPNSFSGLDSIRKLSLSNINIPILEKEYLRGMPKLRELKMEGRIEVLAFDAFLDLPKLENLIMKNCSITKLSMDTFYGLYGLVSLDLSSNELESLPPGLFDQLYSLKELNLRYNKLTTLPAGIFLHIPAKMIRLDKNPWHCTCAMNDWQPTAINKIKVKSTGNTMCNFRFDKGSMCSLQPTYHYAYEKRVTPRCETPPKYKGWSVFHLLRKELRCNKKQKLKLDRRAYLFRHFEDYGKYKRTEKQLMKYKMYYKNYTDTVTKNSINNQTETTTKMLNATNLWETNTTARAPDITIPVTDVGNNNVNLSILSVETNTTYQNDKDVENDLQILHAQPVTDKPIQMNASQSISETNEQSTNTSFNNYNMGTSSHMFNRNLWSKKDIQKYELLKERQEKVREKNKWKQNLYRANEKFIPVLEKGDKKLNYNRMSLTKEERLMKLDSKFRDTYKNLNADGSDS